MRMCRSESTSRSASRRGKGLRKDVLDPEEGDGGRGADARRVDVAERAGDEAPDGEAEDDARRAHGGRADELDDCEGEDEGEKEGEEEREEEREEVRIDSSAAGSDERDELKGGRRTDDGHEREEAEPEELCRAPRERVRRVDGRAHGEQALGRPRAARAAAAHPVERTALAHELGADEENDDARHGRREDALEDARRDETHCHRAAEGGPCAASARPGQPLVSVQRECTHRIEHKHDVPRSMPYASGHAPRTMVPLTSVDGQVPSAYSALKMADAVLSVANDVPTTVMRPVPSQYRPPVKGIGTRVIWMIERMPDARSETATIWFWRAPEKPSCPAKMMGGVMRPASMARAC